MKLFVTAFLLFLCFSRSLAFLSISRPSSMASTVTASQTALQLKQFAPEAVNLFNNMKTPASILGGALVPLGFAAPLPLRNKDGKPENRFEKGLRLSYTVVAMLSIMSVLISVMWSTVAVNQLIETNVKPAKSVW